MSYTSFFVSRSSSSSGRFGGAWAGERAPPERLGALPQAPSSTPPPRAQAAPSRLCQAQREREVHRGRQPEGGGQLLPAQPQPHVGARPRQWGSH